MTNMRQRLLLLLGVATAMEGDLEDGILLLQQTRHLALEQADKWMQGFLCVDLGYAVMRKGEVRAPRPYSMSD
jgi:hypothetical protein